MTKLPEKEINKMNKNTRFSLEVRQRAIHMVLKSQDDYDSLWGGIWIISWTALLCQSTLLAVHFGADGTQR